MESSGNEGSEKKVVLARIGLVGGIVAVIGTIVTVVVPNFDKIAPYIGLKPQTAISPGATSPQMNPTATATEIPVRRGLPVTPKRSAGFRISCGQIGSTDPDFTLEKVVLPSYATLLYFRYHNTDNTLNSVRFYIAGTPEAMRIVIGSRTLSLKDWTEIDLDKGYVSTKQGSPYLEFTVRPQGTLNILGTLEPMPEEISSFYVIEGTTRGSDPLEVSDIEIPERLRNVVPHPLSFQEM